MIRFVKKYSFSLSVLAGFTLLVSCANMSSPSGGSYDLDPPKVLRSNPKFNAVNVTNGKVVIEFDENVTLSKPSEKVIITPPQNAFPVIQAVNKRISVELRDTLLPDMTYTIDFTDAISDNNENNALENFAISFSTGNYVDTLAISGKVLEAHNLEPVKGIYVGLHSNMSDTAFTTTKFLRISRTNDNGEFTIRGVAAGEYKLYALNDANRDYKYDNPAEAIAFLDEIIVPSSERAIRTDTLFKELKDIVEIDSVKTVSYTRFLPDNIVLRSFSSDFQRQYLQKHERQDNKLNLYFGAPTEFPDFRSLNFDDNFDWSVLERSMKNDTLTYWINDHNIAAMDTLSFEISYLRTDSLNQPVWFTDTLNFINRVRKDVKKNDKKKDKEEESIKFLEIATNLSGSWDTYRDITFEFSEPIVDSLSNKITFQQLVDTSFVDIPFQLIADSLNPRKFSISHKWKYNQEFKISIDSAAIHSIYGLWNDKLAQTFKVKAEDQYAALAITVKGVDSIPSFIELLDKSDKPIRKSRVKNNVALFRDLNPGQYYMRIILDRNNNGVWDTGDYYQNLQPEMVCYNQKNYELKAYFEIEDDWVIDTNDLARQKPLDITKNKPQEKASKRKQLEEQEQKKKKNEQNQRNKTNDMNQPNTNINRPNY